MSILTMLHNLLHPQPIDDVTQRAIRTHSEALRSYQDFSQADLVTSAQLRQAIRDARTRAFTDLERTLGGRGIRGDHHI